MASRDESHMQGYEALFEEDLERKYVCTVCLLVMKHAVQTSCGHRFCEACICRVANESGMCKCPVDNTWFDLYCDLFPDVAFQREILSLKVKCKHHHKGCTWTGELRDLEPHQLSDCQKWPVICPLCTSRPMNREDLPHHLDRKSGDCPNVIIQCPFQKYGCSFSGRRETMASHEKAAAHLHLSCMEQKILSQNKHISSLDNKIQQLVGQKAATKQVEQTGCRQATSDKEHVTSLADFSKEGSSSCEKFSLPTLVTLNVTAIRVGTFRTISVEPLLISDRGFKFFINGMAGTKTFHLYPHDIQQCLVYFCGEPNLMFFLTTQGCASGIQKDLGLVINADPTKPPLEHFNPSSTDLRHQMIMIVMKQLSAEVQLYFQRYMELFKSKVMPGDEAFFMELSKEEADDVYRQSTGIDRVQQGVSPTSVVSDLGYCLTDEGEQESRSSPLPIPVINTCGRGPPTFIGQPGMSGPSQQGIYAPMRHQVPWAPSYTHFVSRPLFSTNYGLPTGYYRPAMSSPAGCLRLQKF
ncbi:uncharacterized protein LOC123563068 isoform X1 [Mercenaria mercenaria]|uniref:uncharacterized protein LOC123563068 isoform X1 n=1 Tax=Mercenaria mercenaria TaxID=6596 RepID=UPI00234E4722|nr:uncharacterized protein LOC123563068 isoform X1 [Mercenaria mercenaria]